MVHQEGTIVSTCVVHHPLVAIREIVKDGAMDKSVRACEPQGQSTRSGWMASPLLNPPRKLH